MAGIVVLAAAIIAVATRGRLGRNRPESDTDLNSGRLTLGPLLVSAHGGGVRMTPRRVASGCRYPTLSEL